MIKLKPEFLGQKPKFSVREKNLAAQYFANTGNIKITTGVFINGKWYNYKRTIGKKLFIKHVKVFVKLYKLLKESGDI